MKQCAKWLAKHVQKLEEENKKLKADLEICKFFKAGWRRKCYKIKEQ